MTISYPLFTENKTRAFCWHEACFWSSRSREKRFDILRVGLFVAACVHVCGCNMATEIRICLAFFSFPLHETIWLSFNWLTDVDADSRRARHWPAAREARKPSDKMLHSFWQLPPSSSLHLSPWSRTWWVFCLGQIYSRSKHHRAQPGRLIGKRFVRYEARGERFQHLDIEWVTKIARGGT